MTATVREADFEIAVDGLHFAEGPRWHDGALWFSDMFGERVLRHRPGAGLQTVTEVPGDRPSGLGWLPDGRLLVVAMKRRAVLRLEPDGRLAVHADLASLCRGFANDMIVAADGTAYVGDSGLPEFGQAGTRQPGQLIRVAPDGSSQLAADALTVPNGCALTADGGTLILAEAHAGRIVAFTVDGDGSLRGKRLFAYVAPAPDAGETAHLDGLCLDADGGAWVCEIRGRRLLRVTDGGTVTDCVTFGHFTPVACVLGSDDRRTLFVCATRGDPRDQAAGLANCVIAARVAVPGSGRP